MRGPKGVGALYVAKAALRSPRFCSADVMRPDVAPGRKTRRQSSPWERQPSFPQPTWPGVLRALPRLRDRLEQGILERVPDVSVNGAGAERAPNTTNLCFDGIEGESLVIALDLKGFCVSSRICLFERGG